MLKLNAHLEIEYFYDYLIASPEEGSAASVVFVCETHLHIHRQVDQGR